MLTNPLHRSPRIRLLNMLLQSGEPLLEVFLVKSGDFAVVEAGVVYVVEVVAVEELETEPGGSTD